MCPATSSPLLCQAMMSADIGRPAVRLYCFDQHAALCKVVVTSLLHSRSAFCPCCSWYPPAVLLSVPPRVPSGVLLVSILGVSPRATVQKATETDFEAIKGARTDEIEGVSLSLRRQH